MTSNGNAGMVVFGPVEDAVREQMAMCQSAEDGAVAVLCADNHLGYSMPIGGVIAYEGLVSPSAVGYDIGCGNCAVRTDATLDQVNVPALMDDIWRVLSFGVGRKNAVEVDHPVLDEIASCALGFQRGLAQMASQQLGTIGSGNHYVDLFVDAEQCVWVGVHFGSRGFGHKTATWALAQAGATDQSMMAAPVVIPVASELGQQYLDGMARAGRYAYAGREWVVDRVVKMLGARVTERVHNHHNFAWLETHDGRDVWVHRKGATPAFPGQRGFVGATMGEPAVILEGVDSPVSASALYSTVHGAGRAMSRTKAAGKRNRKTGEILTPGLIDFAAVQQEMRAQGIALRGAGADEAPGAYKRLDEVLAYHAGTVVVRHTLRPVGVAMAGSDVYDPFKD